MVVINEIVGPLFLKAGLRRVGETNLPEQADGDADGIGNLCDDDADGDGVLEDVNGNGYFDPGDDNCPFDSNSGQLNTDGDVYDLVIAGAGPSGVAAGLQAVGLVGVRSTGATPAVRRHRHNRE